MADAGEAARPGGRTGTRHAARKAALDILYEADLKDRALGEVLAAHLREAPPDDYTVELVRGVHRHVGEIDGLIEAHSREWKLARMPIVDRNLLRMALYEIAHGDIPTAVAIDEAVELAKELSTANSPRFVNGLLSRAAQALAAGDLS